MKSKYNKEELDELVVKITEERRDLVNSLDDMNGAYHIGARLFYDKAIAKLQFQIDFLLDTIKLISAEHNELKNTIEQLNNQQ